MPFMASLSDIDRKGNLSNQIMSLSVSRKFQAMTERLIALGYDANGMAVGQLMSALANDATNEKFQLDFFGYAKSWIDKLSGEGRDGTAYNYTTALNSFSKFLDKRHLDISLITLPMLQNYLAWLIDNGVGRRGQELYFSQLNAIYERAKSEFNDEENDVYNIKGNPFKKVQFHMSRAELSLTPKRSISADAIRTLYALSEKSDNGLSQEDALSLDVFLLSFFLCGMNTIDLYELEESANRDKVCFYRHKTKRRSGQDSYIEITIPEQVRHIADKYADPDSGKFFIFHRKQLTSAKFNKEVNRRLKRVAAIAGGDVPKDLQFYAARHTWSTIAANDCHIPTDTIDRCLCHAPKSIAEQSYITRTYTEVDDANKKVIDFILSNYEETEKTEKIPTETGE